MIREVMKTGFYISFIVGLLLFVVLFWVMQKQQKEEFSNAGTTTSSTSSSATSNPSSTLLSSLEDILKAMETATAPENFKYIEDKSAIPSHDTLMIYLSSFSDKTHYDKEQDTYVPQTQRWNNYIKDKESFFLLTTNALPVSIKPPHGLAIKNLTLNGIRSDEINPTSFELGSFTMSFYAKINTLEKGKTITLADIFLETPNHVSIELETLDTTVKFILQVGNTSTRCQVEISKQALEGKTVLITVAYDDKTVVKTLDATTTPPTTVNTSKVHLFIDELEPNHCEIEPKPTLLLGNSNIKINNGGLFDANLYAFFFYKSALTHESHKSLKAYLEKQVTGINNILNALTNMTKDQLATIRSYLDDQTITLEDLKKKLAECQAKTQTLESEKPFQYQVKMDGESDVTKEDMEQCSILAIKPRLPKVTSPVGEGTSTAGSSSTEEKKSRFFLDIPFLKGIIGEKF